MFWAAVRLICCRPQPCLVPARKLHSHMALKAPQWTPYVGPFWKFQCQIQKATVDVGNYDPQKATMHRMTILYDGDENDITINEDPVSKVVSLKCIAGDSNAALRITVPMQVDVYLRAQQSKASVSGIENNHVSIDGDAASVSLTDIKSDHVKVVTKGGDTVCSKSIRGNVDLTSASGRIRTGKLQGSAISLSTSSGEIGTGDLYAEELTVSTNQGHISLKSIHGDCEIQSSKGQIVVGTAEGQINIMSEEGNIYTHLTDQTVSCDISTNNGDVLLGVATDLGAQLDAEARDIDDSAAQDVLNEIKTHSYGPCKRYRAEVNNGGAKITIKAASGKLTLKSSTWPEALLSFNNKKLPG